MRAKSQIRIVSGSHSGQLVDCPKTSATQPMGERERIAIFNQIRDYLEGAKVLDAFAGSGVLGITALSNWADSVDFLEKNPDAIKAVKANLEKHKFNQNTRIVRRLEELDANDGKYDLIFADPPYDNPQFELVQKLTGYLKRGGIFVLSHPKGTELKPVQSMKILSDRSYAAAQITIYKKAA